MSTVYIACSMIRSVGIDFSLLDMLEEWIIDQHLEPFTPGKMDDTSPDVIFERDMKMLEKSDFIVADVNEPSHGVGMEIMYAFEHGMPVICVLKKENRPFSRMVDGSPHVYLIEYDSKQDLKMQLERTRFEDLSIEFCEVCQNKTVHFEKICKRC
ncbi:MAG: nucleoside 2-deoxyribosyltransferase [Candidatus Heimdallarchaeaceae archaeon]